MHATTHRGRPPSAPVSAIGFVFWLVTLVIGMAVVVAVAAVVFTVRLTVKIMVMVCRNLFRSFPG
jgi:hypothetical protein